MPTGDRGPAVAGRLGHSDEQADTPGRDGLAEVASGATLNLVGVALSAGATLGVTILVTREFSPPVAGAFFTATSLFVIVEVIANLGAYNGVIYFVARLRALHAESKIPAVLRQAFVAVGVASLVIAAAMLVFALSLAHGLLDGHLHAGAGPGAVARALRALAVALPFAALADTFLATSRAYRDMRPTVVVDRIGRAGLQLLGVIVAALVGSGALLAPLWALPYVPAAVVSWLWWRRIRRRQGLGMVAPPAPPVVGPRSGHNGSSAVMTAPAPAEKRRWDPANDDRDGHADAREFWRYTAPRSLASAAQIIIQRLDIVLVAILRGPVEAAVYTAATRFLVVGQLANAAISMAAQPQFVHLFARRDRRAANAVYQTTTAWLMALSWPLYLLAMIDGPQVLALLGHSYRAGSTVMVILASAMLLSAACGQVDVVLITTGRSSWSLVNGLLAVTVNVGIDLVLIPKYGITGAAIGWAAAIALANLVPLAQVAAVVRVHPFGRGAGIAGLLATVSFGAIPLGVGAVAGHGALVSCIAFAAGCGVMAAGLWRFRNALQFAVLPGLTRPGLQKGRRVGGPWTGWLGGVKDQGR